MFTENDFTQHLLYHEGDQNDVEYDKGPRRRVKLKPGDPCVEILLVPHRGQRLDFEPL